MEIEDLDQLKATIEELKASWNERDEEVLLRYLRRGWPLLTGLTDDWWRLINTLEKIQQSGSRYLTIEEENIIADLIPALKKVVNRE